MNKEEFKYIIKNAYCHTKYEPIFDKTTLDIYAYEALSKFEIKNDVITTEEIFRHLHHYNDLFFELEKTNKKKQINDFKKNTKLFLNFDADIVVSSEQQQYWAEFLSKYKKDLVIEITENGSDDETSAKVMQNFAIWLEKLGIPMALDDFAQEGSMFSFFILNKAQYVKIDKSFLRIIDKNKNFLPYLEGILKTIKLNNQYSIIEGVETLEDFELIKTLPCDYIQGYYFKNQTFII